MASEDPFRQLVKNIQSLHSGSRHLLKVQSLEKITLADISSAMLAVFTVYVVRSRLIQDH